MLGLPTPKAKSYHLTSSNYALYGDMSHRVMETLAQFTPNLEVYSINEAFLNLASFTVNLIDYGIRTRVTALEGQCPRPG